MKIKVSLIAVSMMLITISQVSIQSCNNNSTDCTIKCYYGACVNNSCNCNTGYEGDSCTVRTVDRFIGDWNAYDSCQAKNFSYTATIAASSSVVNEILITNFGEFGSSFVVKGNVSGLDIEIPNQVVEGVTLNGAGTIDTVSKEISIAFTVKDAFQNSDACSGLWKKK